MGRPRISTAGRVHGVPERRNVTANRAVGPGQAGVFHYEQSIDDSGRRII